MKMTKMSWLRALFGVLILTHEATSFIEFIDKPFQITTPLLVNLDANWTTQHSIFAAKSAFLKTNTALKFAHGSLTKSCLNSSRDAGLPIVFKIGSGQNVMMSLSLIQDHNLGTTDLVLIILPTETLINDMDYTKLNIRIDQEIFFTSMDTLTINEIYRINGHLVKDLVGTYHRNKLNESLTFNFSKANWSNVLGKRRNNFFGANLIAMIDHDPPYTSLNPEFKKKSTFHENNQTFDVTPFIETGVVLDLMLYVAQQLNFTYTFYKRLDGVWGSIVNNVSSGMISNLYHGNADIAVDVFGLTNDRKLG